MKLYLCWGKLSSEYDLVHNGSVTELHFITRSLQKGNRNYMGQHSALASRFQVQNVKIQCSLFSLLDSDKIGHGLNTTDRSTDHRCIFFYVILGCLMSESVCFHFRHQCFPPIGWQMPVEVKGDSLTVSSPAPIWRQVEMGGGGETRISRQIYFRFQTQMALM